MNPAITYLSEETNTDRDLLFAMQDNFELHANPSDIVLAMERYGQDRAKDAIEYTIKSLRDRFLLDGNYSNEDLILNIFKLYNERTQ